MHVPSLLTKRDLCWTYLTWGDATLLSGHGRGPRTAAGDTTRQRQTKKRSTRRKRVSPSPIREPTSRAGRHRPTPSSFSVRVRRGDPHARASLSWSPGEMLALRVSSEALQRG